MSAFRKTQYHSVRRDALLAMRWAEKFGCEIACKSHASASSYFTVRYGDSVYEIRISEHEPNYSRTTDRDYMLYVGGFYSSRSDGLARYADWLGRITGRPQPAGIKAFFTREANRRRREEEARAEKQRSLMREQEARRTRYERVLAAMTPEETQRWTQLESNLRTAHGKRRKRISEKQSRLFDRVADRLAGSLKE